MEQHESHTVQPVEGIDNWALIDCGSRRYFGRLNTDLSGYLTEECKLLVMKPAYELVVIDIPGADPENPRAVGITRAGGAPLNYALNNHEVELIIPNPGPIAFLSSMHKEDQQLYLNMLKMAENQRQVQRAKKAGIVVPQMQMPRP